MGATTGSVAVLSPTTREGLPRSFPSELTRRLVRFEPLALLLPEAHPLAHLDAVPCERLRGLEVDASSGNEDAAEWVDLAELLLDEFGGRASTEHVHVVGTNETARHLQTHGLPILTMSECPDVQGGVVRPLVDPVPLYAWAMVHPRDTRHPAVTALSDVVAGLAGREGWHHPPPGAWLPRADERWTGLELS